MTRTIKMLDTGEVVEVGVLAGDALVQLGRAVAYDAPEPVAAAPVIARKRPKPKAAKQVAAKPATEPKAGVVESLKGKV